MYIICKTKCILTVRFTCNLHFFDSTYFIFIDLKVTSFLVSFLLGIFNTGLYLVFSVNSRSPKEAEEDVGRKY